VSCPRNSIPCVYADGDGAVVNQADFHVRSKNAASDRSRYFLFQPQTELFIALPGHIRSRCANEGRPISLSSIGEKRKLADDEYLSGNILDRAIHRSGIVRKDAEPANLSHEPNEILFSVAFLYAQQNKESGCDFADNVFFNRDRSLRYALNHHPHLTVDLARKSHNAA
jgi:hypothetical protein